MSSALCLRCDWEGSSDDPRCGRCDAPLYRPAAARSGPAGVAAAPGGSATTPWRSAPDGDRPALVPSAPSLVQVPWEPEERRPFPVRREQPPPNPRRRWELAASAALAGVLVVAAAAAIQGGRPPPRPATVPTATPRAEPSPDETARPVARPVRRTGVVAYVSAETIDGTGRLWLFDPKAETVTRGPAVPPVTELVGGTLGHYGLISDGVAALALDSPHADELPYVIAAGEMVAWSGDANTAVVQSRRAVPGRCPASVIRAIYRPRMDEGVLANRPDCHAVTWLGVDDSGQVFVTRTSRGRPAIYRVESGGYDHVLGWHSAIGVSPRGDLLVVPSPRVFPAEVVAEGLPLVEWRPGELPIMATDGFEFLIPERVLAWSADGRFAAVLGQMGSLRSIWRVQLRAGGVFPPLRVAPVLGADDDDVRAAFGPRGTLYEALQGSLYRFDGTTFARVFLPQDAPPITGPIAWLEG